MIRRIFFRFYLYLILGYALVSVPSFAENEGLAGRCVLDSAFLSQSDSLGFSFDGAPKKAALDLERLTQAVMGITYENRPYKEAPLGDLGLPLLKIPGASGRAIFAGGVGEDASWEVLCFRKDKATWMGEQITAGSELDGATWLGQDSALGWPLTEEGSRKAWIFVPEGPLMGMPGKVGGFQAEGELEVHVLPGIQLKMPGSASVSSRKIHVRFKPEKAVHWSCAGASCESVGLKDKESKSLLKSLARNLFIYWNDVDGWLADVTSRKGEDRTWDIQWYLPHKSQLNPSGAR